MTHTGASPSLMPPREVVSRTALLITTFAPIAPLEMPPLEALTPAQQALLSRPAVPSLRLDYRWSDPGGGEPRKQQARLRGCHGRRDRRTPHCNVVDFRQRRRGALRIAKCGHHRR